MHNLLLKNAIQLSKKKKSFTCLLIALGNSGYRLTSYHIREKIAETVLRNSWCVCLVKTRAFITLISFASEDRLTAYNDARWGLIALWISQHNVWFSVRLLPARAIVTRAINIYYETIRAASDRILVLYRWLLSPSLKQTGITNTIIRD